MAYLLTAQRLRELRLVRGNRSDKAPYLVLSSCGQDRWRLETLERWLARMARRRNRRAIHTVSTDSGPSHGKRVKQARDVE